METLKIRKPKTWKKWTSEEIETLKTKWQDSTFEDLFNSLPGRTYGQIMQKARLCGFKSDMRRRRKGTLKPLDKLYNLTPEVAYWWGFIMADGHLARRGDLIIGLHERDKDHLLKLSKLLELPGVNSTGNKISTYGKEYIQSIIALADKAIVNRWLDILEIHSPKTYTPPNLSCFIESEYFLHFLIGFIDGDGCIWNSKSGKNKTPWPNIRIEIHPNWEETLNVFKEKLLSLGIYSEVKMSKRGFVQLYFSKKDACLALLSISKEVPSMERKWSRMEYLNAA